MGVLTVAGPLLVLGILSFDVQLPIVLGALLALAAWMLLTGRHLAGAVPPAVSRLAVLAGAGVLWGLAVAGMGVLLPSLSWPQLLVFGVGAVAEVLACLAMPVWFLLLGRALQAAPDPAQARP